MMGPDLRLSRRDQLVSVVIAAYKSDSYLEQAVRDAVSQTYPTVEVIVSDDAASPDTRAVALAVDAIRVVYRANPTRLGAAGNHWAAIKAARGEWVAILNHDDRWAPTFLSQVMAAVADHPDAVVGFCDHEVIGPDGQPRLGRADSLAATYGRDRLTAGRQTSLPALAARQAIPLAMGAVFRKSAVDLTDPPEDVGPAYDLWLTYLLARSGGSGVYVPARLTSWREHSQNLTSASGRDWVAGTARCWAAMAADPAFAPVRAITYRTAAAAAVGLAAYYLRAGQQSDARAAARNALRYHPMNWRAGVIFALTMLPGGFASRILARR